MFKPLNQICYSEHLLALDHDKILSEVMMAKIKDDVPDSEENYSNYPINHTFFKDSNIYPETADKVFNGILKELSIIFGADDLWVIDDKEIWGHIVEPGQQTIVHNHVCGALKEISLSFAYYPNHPSDSGGIVFQTQINTNVYEASIQPRKGLAIIFDASMFHYTPINNSKYTRVSVSGNLVATDKMLNLLNEDYECTSPYWKYSGKTNV